jgi:hypothetical protein
MVIYDHLGKYDLCSLAGNDGRKIPFFLILPINRKDGACDVGRGKPGAKIASTKE